MTYDVPFTTMLAIGTAFLFLEEVRGRTLKFCSPDSTTCSGSTRCRVRTLEQEVPEYLSA